MLLYIGWANERIENMKNFLYKSDPALYSAYRKNIF